jgi:ATP-binding cassette subfamily B protein
MPGLLVSLRLLRRCLRRDGAAMMAALVALTVAGSGLAALAPLFLKFVMDSAAEPDLFRAAMFALCYAAFLALARIAGEAKAAVYGAAEQRILRVLSCRALSHALQLPVGFFTARSTGYVQQTLENGLVGYRLLLHQSLMTVGPGLLEILILAALILIWLEPAFLIVFAGFAAAYAVIFAVCARSVFEAGRHTSAARTEAQSQLVGSLLNQEAIRLAVGAETTVMQQERLLEAVEAGWRGLLRARLRAGVLMSLVMAIGLLAGLLLALGGLRAGEMSFGDLVFVQASLLQIIRPLEMLAVSLRDVGQGVAFADQLNRLLAEPTEATASISDLAGGASAPVAIRFEKVGLFHAGGGGGVKDVSFCLPAGCKAGIVGLSGSGKSTLLRLLTRLQDPSEGRILLDGEAIADQAVDNVRQRMTFILQEGGLLDADLQMNIVFPNEDVDLENLSRAIAASGLGPTIDRMPDGLGTRIGERGTRLSGGERQRVLIARALYRNSGTLLADEPGSALDAPSRAQILRGLLDRSKTRTVLLVSHRLAEVAGADVILVMQEGRLIEQGTHAELLQKQGHYAWLWHRQA